MCRYSTKWPSLAPYTRWLICFDLPLEPGHLGGDWLIPFLVIEVGRAGSKPASPLPRSPKNRRRGHGHVEIHLSLRIRRFREKRFRSTYRLSVRFVLELGKSQTEVYWIWPLRRGSSSSLGVGEEQHELCCNFHQQATRA